MTPCDLDTPVPEWIVEHPETLQVFEQLGIDYSCGGRSLGFACCKRGLNSSRVLEQLQDFIRNEQQQPS